MRNNKLALLGGTPVRTEPFPVYNTIGQQEKKAVNDVLESGVLSGFLGSWHDNFYGGPKIREFEKKWSEYFNANYTISVNSCTSGLITAIGAVGVEPGEEVIVPPYTMSASATSAIVYNGVPRFVDIQDDIFCLDPKLLEGSITDKTKAIMAVHLFGHPADMDPIMEIANKYDLKVIEDCAQAPGAIYKDKKVGIIGDIGVFSLNFHKTIHTGEGGMIVTNDKELAERAQLVRNHGEAVVGSMGISKIDNLIGRNYRLTELQAAVGIEQLKKLEKLNSKRIELADYFTSKLEDIEGLIPPQVMPWAKHVYYVYPVKYEKAVLGIDRDVFLKALNAEFAKPLRPEDQPFVSGYQKPLYLQPLYQKRIAYGNQGFPFNLSASSRINYEKGLCPVTEDLYEEGLFYTPLVRPPLNKDNIDQLVSAIKKVVNNIEELKNSEIS